tara:strand:+ start:1602 stop:2531 length:930 start_codon:yes stop_codon:yes gene_type:complete
MNKFKSILYADFGHDEDVGALRQALRMTRSNGGKLYYVSVRRAMPSILQKDGQNLEAALEAQAKTELEKAAKDTQTPLPDLDYELHIISDARPDIAVLRFADKIGADVIMKEIEKEGRKGFRAKDMTLLSKSPVPVWICRDEKEAQPSHKVAVAIDPESDNKNADDLSVRLLQIAERLAAQNAVTLEVISCWSLEYEDYLRNNPWAKLSDDKVEQRLEETCERHKNALLGLISKAGLAPDSLIIHHVKGSADEMIPTLTRENNIATLVMGTVARTGIPGFLIGNTAENILQDLECSLIALKPEGFASNL